MKSMAMEGRLEKAKKELRYVESLPREKALLLFEEKLIAMKNEQEAFQKKVERRRAFIAARNFLNAEIDLICGEIIDAERKIDCLAASEVIAP